MIRLLMFLLGKPYETCKSCETLKEQLEYERVEKQKLTDTLLSIIKPKTYENPPVEIQPLVTTAGLFSRRKAALEARDRAEALILKQKKNIGEPDDRLDELNRKISDNNKATVEQLEEELGISPQESNG